MKNSFPSKSALQALFNRNQNTEIFMILKPVIYKSKSVLNYGALSASEAQYFLSLSPQQRVAFVYWLADKPELPLGNDKGETEWAVEFENVGWNSVMAFNADDALVKASEMWPNEKVSITGMMTPSKRKTLMLMTW